MNRGDVFVSESSGKVQVKVKGSELAPSTILHFTPEMALQFANALMVSAGRISATRGIPVSVEKPRPTTAGIVSNSGPSKPVPFQMPLAGDTF